MSRINIFIKYFSDYGGAERLCRRFTDHLLKKGKDVHVYCGENRLEKTPDNISVHELGLKKPGRYSKAKSFFERASKEAVQLGGVNFSFERIEGADIFRPGGGSHRVFMKKSMLGLKGFDKLKKKIKRAVDKVNRYNPVIELATCSHPRLKYIIANSDLVRDEMAEEFGIDNDKFAVIYNGVNKNIFNSEKRTDLREIARKNFKIREDEKAIGFASSNFQLKGLKHIIEALSLSCNNYKLLVAGGRNADEYLSLARSLKVDHKVEFLGKVSDMQKFYSSLDVFCHPTFFDPNANVVNEALCMGIPVTVSRSAGNHTIVLNNKCGQVIEEVNAINISNALNECILLGHGDYQKFLDTDEEVFDKYLDLIESVR